MASKGLLYGGLGVTGALSIGYIVARIAGTQCANPDLQEDFDLASYAGLWYEFERAPNSFEKGDCITALYTPTGSNSITVTNTQRETNKAEFDQVTGTGQCSTFNEAECRVAFSSF